MDKARKSVYFALIISLMFSSLSELSNSEISDRCTELREEVGRVIFSTNGQLTTEGKENFDINGKYKRHDYFDKLQKFLFDLGEIANKLISVPVEKRSTTLVEEIEILNTFLVENPGLFVPLTSSSLSLSFLVHIPSTESVLLSCRDRSPYLIITEVLEKKIASENFHEILDEQGIIFQSVEKNLEDQNSVSKNEPESQNSDHIQNGKISEDFSENPESGNTKLQQFLTRRGNSGRNILRKNSDDWLQIESPAKDTTQPQKGVLLLREPWEEKVARIRKDSPFGSLPHWKIQTMIVKYGEECIQERVALQIIDKLDQIWKKGKLPLFVRKYKILLLSPKICLVETITNAMSVHQLKKEHNYHSIYSYWKETHQEDSTEFKVVQGNFIESLAAYSIITYLLQIKDRHNANIFIDKDGHLIHTDFVYMLSNTPENINLEKSPFKLTTEYVDCMGGLEGPKFQYFKVLFTLGFMEIRKYSEKIIGLISLMIQIDPKLPCLEGGEKVIENLKERFFLSCTERECEEFVDEIIMESFNFWRTRQFDHFQYITNGILY